MFQEDRLRRLGDRRRGKWLDTVVPDGPRWSGDTPPRDDPSGRVGAYDVPHADREEHVGTTLTVHAVLLLYARDEAAADASAAAVEAALKPLDVRVVHKLPLLLDVERSGISREHFGFVDGLSQPAPYDAAGAVLLEGAKVTTPDPVQGVPLGELLIGRVSGHHERAPGPVVPGDDRCVQAGLPPPP